VRRFGLCNHNERTISLSWHLVGMNDEDSVRDTILHEVAHALAGPGAGHSQRWKMMARQLGCSARRCYDSRRIAAPPARFMGACPSCGVTVLRSRRKQIACSRCCVKFSEGRFDAKYLFEWSENPMPEGGIMGKSQVLVKKYKNRVYKVVIENGVYFLGSTHGKRFKSLSGVAQGISGHPTSGRYFFGLVKAK